MVNGEWVVRFSVAGVEHLVKPRAERTDKELMEAVMHISAMINLSQKSVADHAMYYLAHFASLDKSPYAATTKLACELVVDAAIFVPNPNETHTIFPGIVVTE